MARVVSPPKSQFDILATPLLPHERAVFDLFDSNLSDVWEIYVKPHLNGLRPTFVLLNANVGIAAFDVWDTFEDASRSVRPGLDTQDASSSRLDAYALTRRANSRKSEMLEIFCPNLGAKLSSDTNVFATATWGTIFTGESNSRIEQMTGVHPAERDPNQRDTWYCPTSGSESVESGQVRAVFPESMRDWSRFMNPKLAADLRFWLYEPDFVSEQ